jgi:hypothetical protein
MERLKEYKEGKIKQVSKENKWGVYKPAKIVPPPMPILDVSYGMQIEKSLWNDYGFGTVSFLVCLRGGGSPVIF